MEFFTKDELTRLSSKSAVRYALLAHMEFKTATSIRLFAGSGDVKAGGHIWRGVGQLIQIEGLSDNRGTDSSQVTFTLSGVDEKILPLALSDSKEVDQQQIYVYMQLLDEDDQPIGNMFTVFYGFMQPPSISKTFSEGSGWQCQVVISAENLLAGKAKPPYGRYTDRDQQNRHNGDLFFNNIYKVNGKTITWPNY